MNDNWKKENLQEFWNEVATKKHLLQVYENDKVFIDSLEGFVGSGFIAGDTVMVIATPSHLKALEQRLVNQGFKMGDLVRSQQYICFDASETLNSFLVDGEIDQNLFLQTFISNIEKLQQHRRRIRIFGEMVTLLFEQGRYETSLRLETLWDDLIQQYDFTLFCAYPQRVFETKSDQFHAVCCTHQTIITGSPHASTEVYYQAAV